MSVETAVGAPARVGAVRGLVGFTTLSESRDPEEVRELLSHYFDTAGELVGLYGGVVEKFIGDAVMAVWGTPVATEDDAERAVRTGLDSWRRCRRWAGGRGRGLASARRGDDRRGRGEPRSVGQGMVAGDLVNTASRVQSVAEPGSVFVGEATREPPRGRSSTTGRELRAEGQGE